MVSKVRIPKELHSQMEEFEATKGSLTPYEAEKRERALFKQVNRILQAPVPYMNRKRRLAAAAKGRKRGKVKQRKLARDAHRSNGASGGSGTEGQGDG